jgi:hypothetical protein
MGFQRFDEGTLYLIWSWFKFVRLAHKSHKRTASLLCMSSLPRSKDSVNNIKLRGVERKIAIIYITYTPPVQLFVFGFRMCRPQ